MPENRNPAKRFLLRLAAVGLGLLCAAALGEGLLRVVRPQAVGVSRLPTLYERDPELGYRYRASARGRLQRLFEIDNPVVINAAGFHDEEWEPQATPGVAVVGDSFTAALHVPVAQTWTQVAERALREAYPGLRVHNLGLDGTGSDVQLGLLRENVARLAPRLILVAFFENDVADVAAGRLYRETRAGYVLQSRNDAQARAMRSLADGLAADRLTRALFEHLYLVRLGVFLRAGDRNLLRTNVISPGHLGSAALDAPRPSGEAEGIGPVFQAMAALAKQAGSTLWVVPVPSRDDPGRSLRVFRRHAGSSHPVVDLVPALEAAARREGHRLRDLYYRHDGHLNATGNALFGAVVAEALAARLAYPEESRPASGGPSRMRKPRL